MSNRPPTISNSFKSRQIEVTEKLNVTGAILSAGIDLFDIFATDTLSGGIQTLSYNESNYQLAISGGNTVNLSSIPFQINTQIAGLTSNLPNTINLYLSTNSVAASALTVATGITAQFANIPVTVVDVSASTTLTNNDSNKVIHFDTTTSNLSVIVPTSLANGFNVAIMNISTNVLFISASNLRSTGNAIIDQFGGAYIYKQNNNIFAVGKLN